jgi:hypothetical protein
MEFLSTPLGKTLIGIVMIVLGLSFAWKGWCGCVMGRFYYWTGFLPLTAISPWCIHLPPGKRSLVKTKEGMMAHMFMGPSFFLCSLLLVCAGSDMLGWPGTTTLNLVLNGMDPNKPTAISFDENTGRYAFPIFKKSGGTLYKKLFESKMDEDKTPWGTKIDKVLPQQSGTMDQAQQKAKGGGN